MNDPVPSVQQDGCDLPAGADAYRSALAKLVDALDDQDGFQAVTVALREARQLLGRA